MASGSETPGGGRSRGTTCGEVCWGPGGHREAREGRGILLQATLGTLDAVLRWGPSGAFKQRRDRIWLPV